MRIYLDNCVIQDLKNPESSELLNSIKQDKKCNVYCYSEAHLQDLMRDKSNYKFDDLKFMEDVVDSNCWHFNKKILFDHIKPKDFYDPFPIYSENLFNPDELFPDDFIFKTVKEILIKIPLDFNQFGQLGTLPSDFFEEFKSLLEKPTNLYEFICAFGDFTNELSANQNKFKRLVSYLHNNNLEESIFKQAGIDGYDGEKITDRAKFRESYTKYFLTDKKGKYRYDLFLDQYNGLELFSFVKGKPRKQKMMNLINDGRHAFFGGFCDVVVSKDVDFIKKTKFMYEIHEIQTKVMNIQEFQTLLEENKTTNQLGLVEMINDTNQLNKSNIINNEDGVITFKLNRSYFSYFNVVNYVSTEVEGYSYYTKYFQNMSIGTLKNEFEFITNKLIETLGPDFNGNTSFDMNEIEDDQWEGRVWRIDETIVELNFKGKIYLAVYPVKYLKSRETQ
jgi:hypothetical protein